MPKQIDSTVYKVVAGHVITTTASLTSGRACVAIRPDDGTSDDVLATPRQARAMARALEQFANRADTLNRKVSK